MPVIIGDFQAISNESEGQIQGPNARSEARAETSQALQVALPPQKLARAMRALQARRARVHAD